MSAPWASVLLFANLLAHTVLLGGAAWSIAFPLRRIYPMGEKTAWYYVMWVLFYYVFLSNTAFVVPIGTRACG